MSNGMNEISEMMGGRHQKLSCREETILAEFLSDYWLLFAMWCEENGHTVGDAESIRVKLESP